MDHEQMALLAVATLRWQILRALDMSREVGCSEELLLGVLQGVAHDLTKSALRRELDYLAKRDLITINKQPIGIWHSSIDRYGIDIVGYSVECDPGINRPPK